MAATHVSRSGKVTAGKTPIGHVSKVGPVWWAWSDDLPEPLEGTFPRQVDAVRAILRHRNEEW